MSESARDKKKPDNNALLKRINEIKENIKKEKHLEDTLRVLIFKDGICVSSSD